MEYMLNYNRYYVLFYMLTDYVRVAILFYMFGERQIIYDFSVMGDTPPNAVWS